MKQEPTPLDCLQCQLIGRRRLRCARIDSCKEVPHQMWIGPVLLVGWAVTVVAFVWSTR